MNDCKMTNRVLGDAYFFHTLHDDKYKTEYLSFFFSLPLTSANATSASLVARILQRGCEKYPTMKDLSRALDLNFAATVGASAFKCGEREIFAVNLVSLKEQYALGNEKTFSNTLDILKNMLFCPLVEDGGFLDEYFESEKNNLRDSIRAQINNKASYAKRRFIASMCENEPYAVNGEGDADVLETLDRKGLYSFYREVILNAECDVYYVGEKDSSEVEALVGDFFGKRCVAALDKTLILSEAKEPKYVRESMDIAQGHLFFGFRTGITYSSDNYLEAVLFNMILGGDVTSKMFMNLREKMSLCYSCHSMLDASKGLLTAYAGIDPSNYEVCKSAFFEQLENMREGKISKEELDNAKNAYANRMREIADNPSLLPMWYFLRRDDEGKRDPERDARDIMKIDVSAVVRAAKAVSLDTVYILSGEGTEE